MTAVAWPWLAFLTLVCAIWLGRHRQIGRTRRDLPPIHAGLYRDGVSDLPAVSLIVAAKDEQDNIQACVESLLRQDYPNLQIIAVNDRSEDRTGEILDQLARDDSRLRVLHVRHLRPGWFGKNNAMREGLERATADWFCFTDADCVMTSPRSVLVAMRYAAERKADFLSVLPTFETRNFWERVIQPACGGIMMIWFRPESVNDPAHAAAYANGAFMLMTRACYDAVGGHERVKTEVNEDMHMARFAKQAGRRLIVVPNEDLYRVRMYESLGEMWSGWSRIFYGCFGSYRRLIASSLAVIVFSLVQWVSLGTTGVSWIRGGDIAGAAGPLTVAAMVACLAQVSVLARFYGLSRIPRYYALTYPLGAIIGLGALVNAMRRLHGRGTTTWRGTTYRGDRVEPPAPSESAPPDPTPAATEPPPR